MASLLQPVKLPTLVFDNVTTKLSVKEDPLPEPTTASVLIQDKPVPLKQAGVNIAQGYFI